MIGIVGNNQQNYSSQSYNQHPNQSLITNDYSVNSQRVNQESCYNCQEFGHKSKCPKLVNLGSSYLDNNNDNKRYINKNLNNSSSYNQHLVKPNNQNMNYSNIQQQNNSNN